MVKVSVDYEKCSGEALCTDLCPVNVYEMQTVDGGKNPVPVRENDCVLCMICEVNCPTKAITVKEL